MALLIVIRQGHWLIPILIGTVFIISFIVRMRVEISVRQLNRDMTTDGRMADYLKNTMWTPQAMRELKLYNSLPYLISKWGDRIRRQNQLRFGMRRNEIKIGSILTLLQVSIVIVSLWLMIISSIEGRLSIGEVIVVFLAMLTVNGMAMQLSWPISKLYIQSYKIAELVEFLYSDHNEEDQPAKRDEEINQIGMIKLENVSYQYPSNKKWVLKDINLIIKQGETLALVGENGAGKSTLIKLILGFYKPTRGRILIDGKDLNDIDKQSYQKKISAVFQDFVRYNLSIRENITLGNIDKMMDDTRIRDVLCIINAEDILGGNENVDQLLGRLNEGGRDLSGGQWQKIAMCRALYRDYDLIILDEPTASIDPSAEVEVFNKFMKLSDGFTCIFISHRLGWAKHADRIVVLHQGAIIEQGNHLELMKNERSYSEMFKLQASWYSQT